MIVKTVRQMYAWIELDKIKLIRQIWADRYNRNAYAKYFRHRFLLLKSLLGGYNQKCAQIFKTIERKPNLTSPGKLLDESYFCIEADFCETGKLWIVVSFKKVF